MLDVTVFFMSINVQYCDYAGSKLNGSLAPAENNYLTLSALHTQKYLLGNNTGEDKNAPL
jgi:hypothetical protein